MKKTFTILLFFFILLPLHSQYKLSVKEVNQWQSEYSLSTIRKITFENGSLVVVKVNDSSTSLKLDDIQRLAFKDFPDNVSNFHIESGLNIFPNPVKDYLNVILPFSDTYKNCQFNIYDINGQLFIAKKVDESGELKLDVSMLSSGVYVCHYYDGKTIQVKKIIKQ